MHRLFALAFTALVVAPAHADEDPRIAQATQQIEAHQESRKIPGLSVAIVADQKLLWAGGFGLADVENRVPATADTVYRFGSVSKAVTAVAAMRLAEQDRFDLDKPVREYVKNWPEKRWPVTARQLLGHLGGVRHYRFGEIASTKTYGRLSEGLSIFADEPLLQQPGEKFVYTTYGYTLLGCAMEEAAGRYFTPLLDELIFKPAGMVATRNDSNSAIIPNRACGYRLLLGQKLANAKLADTSYKIPGGGLCGTAPDLARLAGALMGNELLDEASTASMWTRGETNDGEATGYGLGWQIGEFEELATVGHGGAQQGTSAHLLICPERGFAVVVLCNLERARPRELTTAIAEIFLGDEPG